MSLKIGSPGVWQVPFYRTVYVRPLFYLPGAIGQFGHNNVMFLLLSQSVFSFLLSNSIHPPPLLCTRFFLFFFRKIVLYPTFIVLLLCQSVLSLPLSKSNHPPPLLCTRIFLILFRKNGIVPSIDCISCEDNSPYYANWINYLFLIRTIFRYAIHFLHPRPV